MTAQLEHIDSYNVDISADYQMRFGYINSKVSNDISSRYKETHPVCSIIRFHSPQGTHRISDSSFIRSLGDVSILFTCKKVIVAPVTDHECYSMMKEQDIKTKIDNIHKFTNKSTLTKNPRFSDSSVSRHALYTTHIVISNVRDFSTDFSSFQNYLHCCHALIITQDAPCITYFINKIISANYKSTLFLYVAQTNCHLTNSG